MSTRCGSLGDLSQQVEEGRDSQRKLQQGLEDESAARHGVSPHAIESSDLMRKDTSAILVGQIMAIIKCDVEDQQAVQN